MTKLCNEDFFKFITLIYLNLNFFKAKQSFQRH